MERPLYCGSTLALISMSVVECAAVCEPALQCTALHGLQCGARECDVSWKCGRVCYYGRVAKHLFNTWLRALLSAAALSCGNIRLVKGSKVGRPAGWLCRGPGCPGCPGSCRAGLGGAAAARVKRAAPLASPGLLTAKAAKAQRTAPPRLHPAPLCCARLVYIGVFINEKSH